jgi:uncharacterized protein (DUF2147 family)
MRFVKTMLFLIVVVAAAMPMWAGGDDILGVWFNQKQDAKIDIFKCGNDYCGKIVWLKVPTYPPDSKEGTPGTQKIDTKNPDAALKNRPILGLQIMDGLQYASGNLWKNGKIYDPDSGKTYNAKATLVSPVELNLRGFVGLSLFGRTEKWTRVNKGYLAGDVR